MDALQGLMPMPAKVEAGEGQMSFASLALAADPATHGKFAKALERFSDRANRLFDASLPIIVDPAAGNIKVSIVKPAVDIPQPNMDESYCLHVGSEGIWLVAEEEWGAIRALQTLLQLLRYEEGTGWMLPFVTIEDCPRFRWRGILLDTSRHFMQVEHVRRLLDGMEMAKLNVLHFHLANDQGFRLECESYPKLHEIGSEGAYYTKDEMRALISEAADRGIRVVPEFCLPGHSVSWQVAYPELSSAAHPPTQVGELRDFFSVPIDPTREKTFEFIDQFVAEMAALFPDPFFHTGGDEVNPTAWKKNPEIVAFMGAQGFASARDLQAYFTGRYAAIVARHGKTAIGWEEVLHSDVDENVVLHLWKDGTYPAGLTRHPVLVSWNYYLDLQQPAHWLYDADPFDFSIKDGASQSELNVVGAEMCNWAETIHGGNLDLRTWPRGAAIAERFWSPRGYCDEAGRQTLYERLAYVSDVLSAGGMRHAAHVRNAMAELYGPDGEGAFAEFAALIEPAAYPFLRRRRLILERTLPRVFPAPVVERYSDVRRFVDHLAAESPEGRRFTIDVLDVIEKWDDGKGADLAARIAAWQGLAICIKALAKRNPRMRKDGIARVAGALAEVASIGLIALRAVEKGERLSSIRAWWLKRRLKKYAYETFFIDKDLISRILRGLRKPDVLNRHNVAIYPGVSHLLSRACEEEA